MRATGVLYDEQNKRHLSRILPTPLLVRSFVILLLALIAVALDSTMLKRKNVARDDNLSFASLYSGVSELL